MHHDSESSGKKKNSKLSKRRNRRKHQSQCYLYQQYFHRLTATKAAVYLIVVVYVLSVCVLVVLELFMPVETDALLAVNATNSNTTASSLKHQLLVRDYTHIHHRPLWLLLLTREECSFGRRLLASVLLGSIMSLVSLGSCLFSINSVFAFRSGPMDWDASRVSAAVPSGVGFLGAGLIFKEAQQDSATGETNHVVHGLTTASSLWVSAAVGMACAGQLYFAACFSVAIMMVLLRFGPRQSDPSDGEIDEEEDNDENDDYEFERPRYSSTDSYNNNILPGGEESSSLIAEVHTPLRRQPSAANSVRSIRSSHRKSRASLGGIV
ncbi:hypothetical protein MPSEU_000396500 [Mayamaea pseudoterrestris]|nr:hypothetical protein MPSEU_000396500 [Mayamaea pseudoterrestris]